MLLKITQKIIRENAFEQKKNPRLSANRPSNNWAQVNTGPPGSATAFAAVERDAKL